MATADRWSPGPGPARLAALLDSARRVLDDRRIREHLRRAERDLRAAPMDHLAPEQRQRRERHLDRLRDYWRRGVFPRNRDHAERTPCFVGADGTPCAVAFLLLADGRDDLVERVAAEENTVRIEHAEDGPLLAWLDRNGLTRAEAARIQPAYSETVDLATTCGPVACRVAAVLAGLVGLAMFAVAEYVGYRLAGDLFPDNALKRRSALGYVTVLNLLLAPLLAVLVYALFP